jgi:hypothetical protein
LLNFPQTVKRADCFEKKQYSIAIDLATLPKLERRQDFRAAVKGADGRF